MTRHTIARFRALRGHSELRTEYEAGDVFHEVPFSFFADGCIVRGAIDCLIRRADGSVRILEFKTGRRREEHQRQAELYRRAAAAVFPDAPVAVDVVYAVNATDH
jgi:RecB family exonuclease